MALWFCLAILAYDALAALIARAVGISYDSFVVPAIVLFVLMGIYAGRKTGGWEGALPIVLTAIVHATLGLYVAALIGPGKTVVWSASEVLNVIVGSIVAPSLFGLAGVAVGIRVARPS